MKYLAVASLLWVPLLTAAAPRTEMIAHRGASHDAPENTLAAIKLAWEQKADGAEFDIRLTKDGKIIVIHDPDTRRTTGKDWQVVDRTLDELRTLDAGKWKGEKFAGEKLPTLDEMLATVPVGKKVYIEVKCGPEIVPALDRSLKAAKLKPAQTPIISFRGEVIAAVKKARPDLPAYLLVNLKPKEREKPPTAAALIARAKDVQADGLDLSASEALDRDFVKAVKTAGLRLDVWTVNDPKVARRLVDLDVDGITTDRPAWLREQVEK